MFRKALIRLGVGLVLVASATVLAAASGSSAGVTFVSAHLTYSHDGGLPSTPCPGPGVNERHYCLVVTNYDNLKQTGGVEVDVTLQNYDQSSLTQPVTHLMWTNPDVGQANLSFVASSGPATCSSVAPTSPNVGQVDCNFPNLPGLGSAAGSFTQRPCPVPAVPSGPTCSTVKLFFISTATASSVDFSASADVKESNPQNGANLDQQQIDKATMSFDTNTGTLANGDATVLLPISPYNKGHLHSDLGSANVDFSSLTSPAFLAQFAVSSGVACVLNVTCTGLDLNTDLSGAAGGTFSSTNQILWTANVAANNTNVLAVHTYDPVAIAPSPPNKLTAAGTRFADCDGVVFTSFGSNPQANLVVGQTYFVRNATTSGGNTSFQVSATAKGSLITVTGTGAFTGSCVRIIGDKSSETTKACSTTQAPAMPAAAPLLCAAKLDNSTVVAYLWDDSNGHVGY
jgi:hypothetical protein